MLGSLARKLRAFGFDTAYYREGRDDGVIELARAEGRVVLTSDRLLHARVHARGLRSLILSGRTDGERISSLLRSAEVAGITLVRGAPLCSLCGGALEPMGRMNVIPLVPATVVRRHRFFLRCEVCGKVYWKGGHWKKLRRLERAFGHRVRYPQRS